MSELSIAGTFRKGSSLFAEGLSAFVLLAMAEAASVTLSAYFFGENSEIFPSVIVHSLLSMAVMFVCMGMVMLKGARLLSWGDGTRYAVPESLWWLLPSLLLASILYSLSIFLGFLLLVIPAIVALVVFSYVPYLAVFRVEGGERGNFLKSFDMCKMALGATILLAFLSLLAEIPGVFFQGQFTSFQFVVLFITALFSNVIQTLCLALFHSLCFATEVGQTPQAQYSNS